MEEIPPEEEVKVEEIPAEEEVKIEEIPAEEEEIPAEEEEIPPPEIDPISKDKIGKLNIPLDVKTELKKCEKKPSPSKKQTPVIESSPLDNDWSSRQENKFIRGYVEVNHKKYDTLEEAKKEGLLNKRASGITYYPKTKKYTLRKGKKLLNSPAGEISWTKLSKKIKITSPKTLKATSPKTLKATSPKLLSSKKKIPSVKTPSPSSIKISPKGFPKQKRSNKYINACYRKCENKYGDKQDTPLN